MDRAGGASPDMGGVSADGKELWLSGRSSGVVYVLDAATGKVTHRIKVDSAHTVWRCGRSLADSASATPGTPGEPARCSPDTS